MAILIFYILSFSIFVVCADFECSGSLLNAYFAIFEGFHEKKLSSDSNILLREDVSNLNILFSKLFYKVILMF